MTPMEQFIEQYGACEYGRRVLAQFQTPQQAWDEGCVQTCLFLLRKLNAGDPDALFDAADAIITEMRADFITNYGAALTVVTNGRRMMKYAFDWNDGMADMLTDDARASIAAATAQTLRAAIARRALYFAADYTLQTLAHVDGIKFTLANHLRARVARPKFE